MTSPDVPFDRGMDVIYATRFGEGPLPVRIRSGIEWEQIARPTVF